jgi:hypothetical protein
LLQRFEARDGLMILASNLRDQIDPAFTRRFHTVVHFPRPEEPERRRLWQLAIAHPLGLPDGVDPAALAALDLTGAHRRVRLDREAAGGGRRPPPDHRPARRRGGAAVPAPRADWPRLPA